MAFLVDETAPRRPGGQVAVDAVAGAAVTALARLLDLRDGYTASHADDVVGLCAAIGAQMALDGAQLRDLAVAARLHDLGKIGVPDAILHKPAPLSPAEWEVMRKHPGWGAEALEGVPGAGAVTPAIRGHHERWDGRGYPDGLAGEAIPLLARIISVADAWHAMTSNRSYRRALDVEHAREELRAGSGTQFDPAVVAALWAVVDAREPAPRFERQAPRPAAPGRRGTAAIGQAVNRVLRLPALRASRDELERLLAGTTVSARDVLGVVEADMAVTVAVIRAANASGRHGEVTDVPSALNELGREQLAAVVEALPTIDYFQRIVGWDQPIEHLRLHAMATQRAVDLIARSQHRTDRDALMAGARLHDLGKLVLEQAYPGYPREVLRDADTPDARVRAEREALGLDHALAGGLVLRRWGLPDALVTMVERHHAPDAEGPAAVLRLADMVAHYAHARPVEPRLMMHVARAAGIDAQQLRTVMFDMSRTGPDSPRATEPSPLSRMETLVLRGLSEAKTYQEIADGLGLSVSTVRSHCSRAYRRLGVGDRSQAVLHAAARGWL